MDAHIPILKRAGMVLVVLGTCDLLAIRSGLFLLGAAAGIGLLSGSLHMASLVRWGAAFALCALGVMMLAWPLMQPVDLTLTQLRLQPRILPSSSPAQPGCCCCTGCTAPLARPLFLPRAAPPATRRATWDWRPPAAPRCR